MPRAKQPEPCGPAQSSALQHLGLPASSTQACWASVPMGCLPPGGLAWYQRKRAPEGKLPHKILVGGVSWTGLLAQACSLQHVRLAGAGEPGSWAVGCGLCCSWSPGSLGSVAWGSCCGQRLARLRHACWTEGGGWRWVVGGWGVVVGRQQAGRQDFAVRSRLRFGVACLQLLAGCWVLVARCSLLVAMHGKFDGPNWLSGLPGCASGGVQKPGLSLCGGRATRREWEGDDGSDRMEMMEMEME